MPVAIKLNPEDEEQYRRSHRFGAALKAGLLAGAIVLLFPGGNPWTSYLGPPGGRIVGRPVGGGEAVGLLSMHAVPVHFAHFAVCVLYAFLLLPFVYHLRALKAVAAGALGGLVLYGLNYGIFRMMAPQLTGDFEINVALAHFLFGGLAAGAMRGFMRPPEKLDTTKPNPGGDPRLSRSPQADSPPS